MKKFVVLMLVLGMASLANAGFVVSASDVTNTTATISVTGSGNTVTYGSYYLFSQGAGVMAANAATDYVGNGQSAEITYINPASFIDSADESLGTWGAWADAIGYANVTGIYVAAYGDSTDPFAPLNVAILKGISASGTGATTFTLLDNGGDSPVAIASTVVNFIPEPATMALLGLGGLIFARRK